MFCEKLPFDSLFSTIDIPAKESHSHFFFLIFKFLFDILFWCVFGHVSAWVLLWDEFRWKPDILGGVGTCLGLILDDASLKMLKNCFCICSCMCGLKPAYATYIHAYTVLLLRMQVCFWGSAYVGVDWRMWGLVYVHGFWPAYVRHLAKALLCPFSLIFQPFQFHVKS